MMSKVPGLSKKWRLMRKIKILERTNWTQDKWSGGINRLKWECGGRGGTEASNQFLDKPHEMLVLVLRGITIRGPKWTGFRCSTVQFSRNILGFSAPKGALFLHRFSSMELTISILECSFTNGKQLLFALRHLSLDVLWRSYLEQCLSSICLSWVVLCIVV